MATTTTKTTASTNTGTTPGKTKSRGNTPMRVGAGQKILLSALALLWIGPLLFMLSTAFKSPNETARRNISVIPQDPSTEGFDTILGAEQTPVMQWFFNSLLAATGNMILVLVVASMAAYALARMEFPFKRSLTALIIATLFVPHISLLVPNYVIVSELRWLDSLTAVIVPGAAGAFGVFFLRQFFISLPMELEEAALIDGANRLQIFMRVILPLSKPALATLGLLSFLTNWNDFLWPLYVLFTPERLTLQPGLSTLQSAYATEYYTIMAGGVIASLPVLILFAISQRFVIEGVSRSGLKG